MIFPQKQQQARLVDIIGDPHADESKWMAACIAVGEKSLVKDEPAAAAKAFLPVGKAVARRLIALNVLFSWATLILLAQQYTILMGGPGRFWIGDHLGAGPGLGMILSFFGALGFWRAFSGAKKNKRLRGVWLGIAGIGLAMGIVSHHPGQFTLAICAGFMSFWTMSKLANYTRKTLPPTFRSDRTLLLCGFFSAPCAILMICTMIAIAINPVQPAGDETVVSLSYMASTLMFAALSIMVPAYVCTRVARSSSVASCLALNSLFSAPLVSGLFIAALVTSLTNIDPANLVNTGTFALSLWGAWLSSITLVAVGAYLGAKRNAGVQRRKLKRAGGQLLLDHGG